MSLDIKRGPLSHMQAKKGPGPEVIKLFSTQLSVNLVQLIYLKLLIIANSFMLNIAEQEIFSANKYENANYCQYACLHSLIRVYVAC